MEQMILDFLIVLKIYANIKIFEIEIGIKNQFLNIN